VVELGNRGKLRTSAHRFGGAYKLQHTCRFAISFFINEMAASDQVDQCSSGWTCLAQNFGDPRREAVMKYALKIGFSCRQERELAGGVVALNV
jgi:hypothetical protein